MDVASESRSVASGAAEAPSPTDGGGGLGPLVRVVAFFGALGAFQVVFTTWIVHSAFFRWHLEHSTALASSLLRVFGLDAAAAGNTLSLGAASVRVERGCDGVQTALLFTIAVLFSQARPVAKLRGLALGVLVIGALNVVRVATLLIVQVRAPRWFDDLHNIGWPLVILFVALATWLLWARSATRPVAA